MIDSSMYRKLPGLVAFIRTPHVLEVFDGASRGVSPRDSVAPNVDDDAVIEAVYRLIIDGVAVEAGPGREDLLRKPPALTDSGWRLHAALEDLSAG